MHRNWSMIVVGLAWAGFSEAVGAEGSAAVARPYAVTHEAPLEPVEAVVSETDQYTQLRVEFNGIKGDRVPAFLYLPDGPPQRRPAVLLQYGVGGNKGTNYIVDLGRQFVAHGFVVLTIDVPGRGERAAKERRKVDWFLSNEGRDLFVQYCGDYSRAVDYLVARPQVDPERIGYVGISWGAITGVTFVAHEPRVRAMASVVGGGNFLGTLTGKPPEEVNGSAIQIDPVYHAQRIAPRPLLFLNATRDQLVPRGFAEALHQAAGEGAQVVWLDTDHYMNGADRHEVGEAVIRFIEEHLPSRSATTSNP